MKYNKCIVKDCVNQEDFVVGLCIPCYDFITKGEGVHSQAYRNALKTKKVKKKVVKHGWVNIWENANGERACGIISDTKELSLRLGVGSIDTAPITYYVEEQDENG
jgi:hypothetical protein